jgi:DnaK suppressor protein
MNATNYDTYHERLRMRRSEVIRTLEHVQNEQRMVDENKEWIDKAAYRSRRELLDSLAEWYVDESSRIDDALIRIRQGGYGICLGCGEPIDPLRLEAGPDAAFCAGCQNIGEEVIEP